MKIKTLNTCVIEANYDWTIVRVSDETGTVGYGEAFFAPGLTAVIREFRPILIGEDPRDLDRLCRKMRTCGAAAGAWGMILHAVSGIEAALLDLLGKRMGVPIYQLLGGKYRDRIRIYADCHGGSELESLSSMLVPRRPRWLPGETNRSSSEAALELRMKYHGAAGAGDFFSSEDYAKRARSMADLGFTALKFDVDVPNPYAWDDFNRSLSSRELEYMISLVEAVTGELGKEVETAIDCHWNFSVNDALRFARACERFDLLWLEDPVPPDNIEALGTVARGTRTPIASGENHYGRWQFHDLLKAEAVNIAAPDLQKAGGLLEARRIADLAELFFVNLAPHNISGPIGTVASAHLCAAVSNFLCLEWHAAGVPFFDRLVRGGEAPLIEDGFIRLPGRPGLGIELDEDVAFEFRKLDEPFFEES